jgi:gamma-glutamylcyclotransferase (GGCT)/AIG2-like uncharacterized protein YtfP
MTHYAASGPGFIKDASGFVGGVIIGVIGSLVGLWLLFSIKPSLRLTWEEGFPGGRWWKRSPSGDWWRCSPSGPWQKRFSSKQRWKHLPSGKWWKDPPPGVWKGKPEPERAKVCHKCGSSRVHYRVEIENLALGSVVEVEARLWRIRVNGLRTRERVSMDNDNLLELRGKWHEARRPQTEIVSHTGDSFYHFRLPCCVSATSNGSSDQYLFQVWSKHGFTNFGRVHKLRIRPDPHSPVNPFGCLSVEDPGAERRRALAPIAAITARLVKRPMPVTYFAYGSNMAAGLMAEQCPDHRCIGRASLTDYRLAFTRRSVRTRTGVADIVPAPDEMVWGMLYKIDDYGLAAIDYKEGNGWAYRRVTLQVRLEADGSQCDAVTYTVIRKEPTEVPPSSEYLGKIIASARARGLPLSYVDRLEAVSVAKNHTQPRASGSRAPQDD